MRVDFINLTREHSGKSLAPEDSGAFFLFLFADALHLFQAASLTAKLRILVFAAIIVSPRHNSIAALLFMTVETLNLALNLPERDIALFLEDNLIDPEENQTAN